MTPQQIDRDLAEKVMVRCPPAATAMQQTRRWPRSSKGSGNERFKVVCGRSFFLFSGRVDDTPSSVSGKEAMTPELLALLTPEQREVWERCQKAVPGPWETAEEPTDKVIRVAHTPGCKCDEVEDLGHYCGAGHVVMRVHDKAAFFNNRPYDAANLSFIAHARQDLPAALLKLAQAKRTLAELRAAVADAPHDMWCAVTFPAAPADLMVCNCWKSRLPK